MRRLKHLGANDKCLMTLFIAHNMSVITYGAPACRPDVNKTQNKIQAMKRQR